MTLFIEQCLNGLQFGLLLFLLAAGLTLVFGIMDLVNLAHGSLYMLGAYFAATFAAWTGSFVLGAVLALGATLLVGMAVEVIAMRSWPVVIISIMCLWSDPVLDELVWLIWGARHESAPPWLNTSVRVLPGVDYSAYKLSISWCRLLSRPLSIFSSCARALALIRAGASNREIRRARS